MSHPADGSFAARCGNAIGRRQDMRQWRLFASLVLAASALLAGPAAAQSNPAYIRLGTASGALYRPDSGPAPHVGIIVMHRTSNYLAHPACTELSRRGFLMLCMNSRFANNESQVDIEKMPLEIKDGVNFLKRQPGITKVLFFAHSGGGPLLSFYQAVAENGPSFCQGPGKLVSCGNDLAGLPPVDGIVFADAHPGNPVLIMRGLNPSLVSEKDPPERRVIANLDPFDPKNGYNPSGPSHYSPEFRTRYFKAQAQRMMRLVAEAQKKMQRIAAGTYGYPDDDIMLIPGGGNPGPGAGGQAFLYALDPSIPEITSTSRPEKLLKNDGTIVSDEIVTSVAVPNLATKSANRAFATGTKIFTLRSFLSANAIRAGDAIAAIDWCSSNNSTVCAVQHISVPVMFAAMGGYFFVRDGEVNYDHAASKDKDFVVIEGALHGFTPCTACEKTPGQYANSQKNLFDYAAKWIDARF
jgi:hypothetical protein